MSRSYKKHPICSDHHFDTKFAKNQANRRIRRRLRYDTLKGNQYRKIYDSYNIHDYHLRWTEQSAREWYKRTYENQEYYKDENKFIHKAWFPFFKRK